VIRGEGGAHFKFSGAQERRIAFTVKKGRYWEASLGIRDPSLLGMFRTMRLQI